MLYEVITLVIPRFGALLRVLLRFVLRCSLIVGLSLVLTVLCCGIGGGSGRPGILLILATRCLRGGVILALATFLLRFLLILTGRGIAS